MALTESKKDNRTLGSRLPFLHISCDTTYSGVVYCEQKKANKVCFGIDCKMF